MGPSNKTAPVLSVCGEPAKGGRRVLYRLLLAHLSKAVSFLVLFLAGNERLRRASQRRPACSSSSPSAAPFQSCFLPCLVHSFEDRLANVGLVPGFDKRPGRTVERSPRAVPWEKWLPWAPARITQRTPAAPVRDDRVRGSACAKAAGGSTSRGVATSVTARIPPAGGRFAAGKRRGGRRSGA